MKVGSRGPSGIPTESPETQAPPTVEKPPGEVSFSEQLNKTAGPAGATAATGPASPEKAAPAAGKTPLTGDIGTALEANEISVKTAVDQVVTRILDKQIGSGAPAGARSMVETALRDALENDPLLTAKMKTLNA